MENTYENKSVFSSMEQLENFLRKQEVENMAENKERKINVLGTEYKYFYKSVNQDEKLRECDGYCDSSMKHIVVCDLWHTKIRCFCMK